MEENDRLEAEVKVLAPAADSWNTLARTEGDYSVRDAAKILSRDPSIRIGQNKLFGDLFARNWIYRDKGDKRPRAYQNVVDSGWLSERPQKYGNKSGDSLLAAPQIGISVKGVGRLHTLLGGTEPLQIEEGPAA